MTAEIKAIYSGPIPYEPDPDIIELLEELLDRANTGAMNSFAYSVSYENGNISTGWEGKAGTRNTAATGIALLQHRYMQFLLEQGE